MQFPVFFDVNLKYLAIKKFKEQSALSSVLAACRVMVITVFMYLRLFYFLIYYCIYSKWTLPFENKPTALPWFTESIFSFLVYYSKWYQPFGTEPTIFIWFKESIFSLVYFFIMISSIRNWTCNFALVQGIQFFFPFWVIDLASYFGQYRVVRCVWVSSFWCSTLPLRKVLELAYYFFLQHTFFFG